MEELSVAYVTINIDLLKKKYIEFHRFAFWHDVGVTALSALATALLTVNKTTGSFSGVVLIVPFLTGFVTVFVACDHFFKFRSKSDQYKKALHQLQSLQIELTECECNNGVSSQNRSKEEIYREARKIMLLVDIIPDVDNRVFHWFGHKSSR